MLVSLGWWVVILTGLGGREKCCVYVRAVEANLRQKRHSNAGVSSFFRAQLTLTAVWSGLEVWMTDIRH